MKTTEQKKSSGILRRQKKIDEWNFPYTANFYMGCPYQCKYCYTQQFPFSQHVEFGTELKVKLDAPVRIRKELERLKGIESKFKEVQVGNTWDVYQPAERKYRLTRQCLEVFMDYPEWKTHLVTRSPIILDDLDLLAKMPKLEVVPAGLKMSHVAV